MADVPVVQAETVPQDGQVEILLKDEGAETVYTNFARVSATPEELIIDLGINANPFAEGQQEVLVSTKAILGLYTAKRLLAALQMTIARHEEVFGVLELDVRQRVKAPVEGAGALAGG
jgi:uncharacterized protein VirK/YbjX